MPGPPRLSAVRPVDDAHFAPMTVVLFFAKTLESDVVPANDPAADEVPPVSWGRSNPGSLAPLIRTSNPEN